MRCPSCGSKGKADSRVDPGEAPAFEFRGRLGAKVIVRCLQCGRGVFVRMVPPGYKAIPPDEWEKLDEFWNMRRAEILADLQANQEYTDRDRPVDERVAESQVSFVGQLQSRNGLLYAARRAGYASAESFVDLMNNDPVQFARIALTARQQNVIHDSYEEILRQGGFAQADAAAARIAAARAALVKGEEGIRAFLSSNVSSQQ
jgi:hypothetical protein